MSATEDVRGRNFSARWLLSMSRMKPFWIWLAGFYLVWSAIVIQGGYWDTVLSHWPIALAMSFGSYIAGSTPMGGGTVGFPVLVLIFDLPGSLGRNFGLAVVLCNGIFHVLYSLGHSPEAYDHSLPSPSNE